MKIEKTFTVNAPRQQVWEFITVPELVAPCIPGCEGAEETEAGKYKAVIKTKVGPIKTTFKVDIERTEERPPEFASYDTKGEEGSRASRIKATSTLSLNELGARETEVTYTSDINMMGRLGKFGSGMMQKVADGIGNEFVAALKEKLEEKKPDSEGSSTTEETTGSLDEKSSFPWWIVAIIAVGAAVFIML